jgi:hypothetical protein
MYARRLFRLAVAGAALATGIGVATPASASVTYDPDTQSGFVDQSDVQTAFGWTDETLASRASGLVFKHDFWTDDTYSLSCGAGTFPMVHHRVFGNYELLDTVAHAGGRGAATGYGGTLTGFRITGPHLGISGTTAPPAPGQPCPEDHGQAPGSTIDQAHLVSSITGWALAVTSANVSHHLLVSESATDGASSQPAAESWPAGV